MSVESSLNVEIVRREESTNRRESSGHCTCKVSVIIPIYNAQGFLKETLDSIRNQTLKEIEIICIDDASSDASVSIVKEAAGQDNRISLIECSANRGAGAAINKGLDAAQGEFVQVLGNDDLLEPDALTFLYDYCTSKNIDFCQYAVTVFTVEQADESIRKRIDSQIRYHAVKYEYPVDEGIHIMCLSDQRGEYRMSNGPQFIKRSLLDKNGIRNIEGIHHEDMYFTYRVFLASERATILKNPLYRYRIRSGSLESSKGRRTHTAHECLSLLASCVAMLEVAPKQDVDSDELASYFDRRVYPHIIGVMNKYVRLSKQEKDAFERCTDTSALLYTCVFEEFEREANKLDETQRQLAKIEGSKSYKIGHAILRIPYLLMKVIKHR